MPGGANKWLFVAAPVLAVVTAFMAIAVVPYGGPSRCRVRVRRPAWLQAREVRSDRRPRGGRALHLRGHVPGRVRRSCWPAGPRTTSTRCSAACAPRRRCSPTSWRWGCPGWALILLAGSFRMQDIVRDQAGLGLLHWNAFVQFPAFVVYVIAATAEVNRTPFDLPEAETELVAGFHTEYSSMRFALLQMAEYVNMITVSALGTNLFLGGWHSGAALPAPTDRSASLVLRSRCGVRAVLLHLAARDAAALPLRPAHALRLEGAGARWRALDSWRPPARGARWSRRGCP